MPPRTTAWLALALAAGAGCDSGPKVAKVTGTVTAGGKPVPGLCVHFMPQEGRPSSAFADDAGRFELMYRPDRPGVVLGTHKVFVTWGPRNPQEEVDITAGKLRKSPEVEAVLEKYGSLEATPLRVEVTGGEQVIDLKLD